MARANLDARQTGRGPGGLFLVGIPARPVPVRLAPVRLASARFAPRGLLIGLVAAAGLVFGAQAGRAGEPTKGTVTVATAFSWRKPSQQRNS